MNVVDAGKSALEFYSKTVDAVRRFVGRDLAVDLPDVMTKEWLSSQWGHPLLFYWKVDPVDIAGLYFGTTIVRKLAEFGISYGVGNLLDKWAVGAGSKEDILDLGPVYGKQWDTFCFVPSTRRFIENGYIRVNGVIVKERYYLTELENRKKGKRGMSAEESKDVYDNRVVPEVRRLATALGLNFYLLLGQMNLETAFGKKKSYGNFNYAGIKSTPSVRQVVPGFVVGKTTEYIRGKKVTIDEPFASFDSPEHFAQYYVNWLSERTANRFYKEAVRTFDHVKAALLMAKGGYATDPAYAQKLAKMAASAENADKQKSGSGNVA